MEYILETTALTKEYQGIRAVNDIGIHVAQGDIYGLIGRNGAGKTTTLKMIGGLARPTSGSFSLFGYSYQEAAQKNLFSQIGTLIEEPGVYTSMSAYENLRIKCILAGKDDHAYIMELLEAVRLDRTGKKKVKGFSLGMKQRLGIALALVGEPKLIMLDEPTNGLDPQGIVEIRELIKRFNQEKQITFIVSSHILGELGRIANRFGIIHEGKLITEFEKRELDEKGEDLEAFYFRLTGGTGYENID